jgi:hypothetical protein
MADDYSIKAKITADASGFKSGVNTAIKSSKSLSSSIQGMVQGLGQNGLIGSLAGAGLALGGVGVALGAAKKAFQAVAQVVGECTEAYKKQHIAEEQLRLAVQNSSEMASESSENLLKYASSLQKASNYGDEELIPMMTKLIASGRTEAETMKIMQAAIDMSATGTISLDTAITQLNGTLNGNIGRLGQQNKELKGLTEEELKNGKAVDILAGKYSGMAEKSIDSSKQLKNAWGDLKETMGSAFENAMSPMRAFFAELIQGWADARKERQAYNEAEKRIDEKKGTKNDYLLKQKQLEQEIAGVEEGLRKDAEDLGMTYEEVYSSLADWEKEQLERKKDELDQIKLQIRLMNEVEESEKRNADRKAKAAEQQEKVNKRNKEAADYMADYNKKIAEQERRWAYIEKVQGEVVSQEEKIKFYQETLISTMTAAGSLITENNQFYKKQIELIDKMKEGLEKAVEPAEDLSLKLTKTADAFKKQYKSAFTDTFTKLGESLVEGGKSFEDYSAIAVNSIAEVLKALAEELIAQAAVNAVAGNFAKAAGAAAGAAAALVAAGSLSAVANKMSAIKEAANDATSSIEAFKQSLKEIQESRFTKSGTITLGLTEMQEQLDILREKQEDLKKNSIVTYDAKTIKSLESVGIRKDDVKVWHEYQDTLKQIKVTEKELAEALENVRSSLDKTVNENRKVINSYKDFYGASKLIVDAAGYQYEKYSVYLDMIKQEQKAGLQELETEVYNTFQNFGQSIGQAMMSSFINGTEKADFFDEMKKMIKETVLKMAVYTESFTEQLSEVGADLVNALMGGEDLEDVTKRITVLYDETSKIAEQFADKIDDIFGKVEKSMGIAISQFAKNMKSFKETIKDVTGDLGQTFINGLTEGMTQGDFLTNIKDYLKKLMIQMVVYTDTMKAEIEEIGKRISAGIVDGFTDTDLHEIRRDLSYMFEEASQKVQSIEGILGGVFGGYATGTDNARRGLAMVGEAGPELVKFRGGEQVLNARNTQRALNGMAGNTNNFNVTFNNTTDTSAFAMVSQLKAYNRQMAINGVI